MDNEKYKIVQIIDTLEPGGAERVLITIANILFSKGHQVAVITTLHEGKLANQLCKGITLKVLNRKSKWNLADMKKLIEWCQSFDIIHVHSTHNLRYLFLASIIFGLHKKIFFHHHFGNIEIDQSVQWTEKWILPKTIVIAVSRKIYEWTIDKIKMNKQHVYLLPNIVQKQLSGFGLHQQSSELQIVLVANFRAAKNIEFAVDLMHHLIQQQKAHLTIVGQVADENYCNNIKSKIEELSLTNYITIVHNCTNVSAILHQFDIAIHTATSESGPLVLIEYMAAGLPFLTYKTGEVVYQIENDLSECVIDEFEISAWIRQINRLLQMNRDDFYNKLQHEYTSLYSEDAYYKALIAIYSAT